MFNKYIFCKDVVLICIYFVGLVVVVIIVLYKVIINIGFFVLILLFMYIV